MVRFFDLAASNVLEGCRRKGVLLRLDSDRNTILAWGPVDDGIREDIRLHRAGLIELLEAGEGEWVFVREINMNGSERKEDEL